jgi:4-diphosphocytidyl-2-C-methyl-D-erythritol kinase
LMALSKLWKRQPSSLLLNKCALQLGADVPFFLKGGTCAAGGIGEKLRPLPRLPKTWLVLVYPGFGVSTREAYSKIKVPLKRKQVLKMLPLLTHRSPKDWIPHLFNRFEEFVFPDHPELPRLKQDLIDAGAVGALMSGSGSSVFGIVESEKQGRQTLARIQKKYNRSWLVHTI